MTATPLRAAYRRARVETRPYQRFIATVSAAAIAPLVPTRLDPTLTRTVSRVHLALLPRRRRSVAARMARHLGHDDPRSMDGEAIAYWRQRVETRWGQARGISPTGWAPRVEVFGIDHLEAAVADGRGAILWRMSSHTAIPLNQALAGAGYPVAHLSKHNHLLLTRDNRLWRATSPTMARILRKGEVEPLRERVEYGPGGPVAATRRLMSILTDNGVVTIVGDLATGKKTIEVAVNQDTIRLANGAPRLAVKTGAALLPVTLSRTGPLQYRVDISEPLTVPEGLTTEEAVRCLIDQFGRLLAEFIRRQPSQWSKWRGPTS